MPLETPSPSSSGTTMMLAKLIGGPIAAVDREGEGRRERQRRQHQCDLEDRAQLRVEQQRDQHQRRYPARPRGTRRRPRRRTRPAGPPCPPPHRRRPAVTGVDNGAARRSSLRSKRGSAARPAHVRPGGEILAQQCPRRDVLEGDGARAERPPPQCREPRRQAAEQSLLEHRQRLRRAARPIAGSAAGRRQGAPQRHAERACLRAHGEGPPPPQ